jgi:uncharacterized membrane protein HdeD (DUF308 family)
MTDATGTSPTSLGAGIHALRAKWGWVVALGLFLMLCGVIAIGSMVAATVISVWVVGIMMVIAGAGEVVHGFAVKSWGKSLLWILLGLFYALAGVFAIMNPLLAASVFTLLLAFGLIASGIVRIYLAFHLKEGMPWGWVISSGLITLLLGVMILAQWPAASLWVLGMFLGIDMLFAGSSWLTMGLALRGRR